MNRTILKSWKELKDDGISLGSSSSCLDKYPRCKRHHKLLSSFQFSNGIVGDFCKYCALEENLKNFGQRKEVVLYQDGQTIQGGEGNHRAFILGVCLGRKIRCLISNTSLPPNLSDLLKDTFTDEFTVPPNLEMQIALVVANDKEKKYSDLEIANIISRGRNISDKTKVQHLKEIRKVGQFLQTHPEFKGLITKPGEPWLRREQRIEEHKLFRFGKILEIMQNQSLLQEIIKVLKDKKMKFSRKDTKIQNLLESKSKLPCLGYEVDSETEKKTKKMKEFTLKVNPSPNLIIELGSEEWEHKNKENGKIFCSTTKNLIETFSRVPCWGISLVISQELEAKAEELENLDIYKGDWRKILWNKIFPYLEKKDSKFTVLWHFDPLSIPSKNILEAIKENSPGPFYLVVSFQSWNKETHHAFVYDQTLTWSSKYFPEKYRKTPDFETLWKKYIKPWLKRNFKLIASEENKEFKVVLLAKR